MRIRIIISFFLLVCVWGLKAQTIGKGEYFFDSDPGKGNGTPFSFTAADSVDINISVSVSSLGTGFHNLFIRVQDANGVWSLYEGRNFFVQPSVGNPPAPQLAFSEYFFDNDPGVGNGTAIAFTAADSVDINASVPTGTLGIGPHNLYVRTIDAAGKWSLYEGRNFFVRPAVTISPSPQITAAEYFFDSDPGIGNGTAVAVTTGDSVDVNSVVSTSALATGFHKLFTRVQDANGAWSLYEGRNFFVQPPPVILPPSPKIVAAEYFFDSDPGIGNGTAATSFTAADSVDVNDNISVASLSTGTHNFFVRVKDSTGTYSLYEGKAFNIIVCNLSIGFASTDASCKGNSDGTATATPSGGIAPYGYVWGTSPMQNTATATGLAAGKYGVTVTDSAGCYLTDSVTVGEPAAVTLSVSKTNTTCNQPNGEATVTAMGGSGSYNYFWSTTPPQVTPTAIGLDAGTYSVSVTDMNGCSAMDSVIIAPSTGLTLTISTTSSNCGVAIGSATVSVSGGSGPYKYSWSSGDNTATADSLFAGIYIITVTDATGCSEFKAAVITNANGPQVAVNSVTDVSCKGGNNGAIDVSVSNGTPPYTYSWSNGSVTQDLYYLYAGPYELTVTDASGCQGVKSIDVNEPASALALSVSTTKASCGLADGSASVAVSGGTGPYSYQWSNNVTTSANNGIAAGVYSVTVTDANGCSDSTYATVSNNGGPVVTINAVTNGDCINGIGGGIDISVTGGTPSYTYSWSNGSVSQNLTGIMTSGIYSVTVTDQGGCITSAAASINMVPPSVVPICIVTVDTITNRNLLVWEKTAGLKIASYNVYKESTQSGVYYKIGSVPFNALSVFYDSVSNPDIRSWRYKISVVDSCGNESALSASHKTMHLTINQGISNNINLIWDNYEGLAFGTYYVYRDTVPTTVTQIDSIPNNIFTYTDNLPAAFQNKSLYYKIGIVYPAGCNPTMKAQSYNSSKSNTANQIPGYQSVNMTDSQSSLNLYPNPSSGTAAFELEMPGKQNATIRIYNLEGQRVYSERLGYASSVRRTLNLGIYGEGIYTLQVITDRGVINRKVAVVK